MTSHLTQHTLREMLSRWLPEGHNAHPFRVHTDTTDFFRVDYGDVVVLDGAPFLIRHNAKEGRFGLDDEVKYWVKRAIDLRTGDRKILKLVFHEKFVAHVGDLAFECFRSPRKEARILDLVAEHSNFMHGYSVQDEKGNIIRILDLIQGLPLSRFVENVQADHQTYFFSQLPAILDQFIEAITAVGFLHEHGEKHGDIRRDHLYIDRTTGHYRWIDFDFNYRHRENIYGYDLFGLGNILVFLVGKGDVIIQDLVRQNHPALSSLTDNDVNIIFNNRVVNLQKVFRYIPDPLNRILIHFSKGANWFYERTRQLLEDLGEWKSSL